MLSQTRLENQALAGCDLTGASLEEVWLDGCSFEQEPLRRLAQDNQLMSYKHRGFWQCMDNIREKEILEKLIAAGKAPWMKWDV